MKIPSKKRGLNKQLSFALTMHTTAGGYISRQLQYTEQGLCCKVTAYHREVITFCTTHEEDSLDILVHCASTAPNSSKGE